jgi:hypothetical protein
MPARKEPFLPGKQLDGIETKHPGTFGDAALPLLL